MNKGNITFFGQTSFRNLNKKFGIKTDDRRRHFYVIGKTGMGKTELLKNMAIQDIRNGNGMGFVDPHGEASEDILSYVPKERIQDVVYVNPADMAHPIAFNVMENVNPELRHLVASGLMSVFKKIWPDVWSARMEYILNNAILALLEYPEATLLGVNRMLVDVEYRSKVVDNVKDPITKAFWTQEYARYTQRYEIEATAAIQNKVGQFVSNPLIRNIIGQVRSSINMREIMDSKKILIVNLSKGRVGEDNSRLLGALIITKLQLAAMSRVDIPEDTRKDFFLYIDEFQNFASESFVNILSEARKYRLSLILGHQYIMQLEETVRDGVFGNVGTIVSFRVGAEDAEFLEKEFTPEFLAPDFVNLGKYHIYLKLMIDGLAGRPFSATTLPPLAKEPQTYVEEIIEHSRKTYSIPVEEVEKQIREWTGIDTMTSLPAVAPVAERPLFDARCSSCGKDTKVPFQPDGKRPVYCKNCRKKMQEGTAPEGNNGARPIQEEPAPPVPQPSPIPPVVREAPRQERRETEQQPMRSGPISLAEAATRAPMTFQGKTIPKENKKPRREVNIGELRQVLADARVEQPKAGKKGVLEPGKTVYLDS